MIFRDILDAQNDSENFWLRPLYIHLQSSFSKLPMMANFVYIRMVTAKIALKRQIPETTKPAVLMFGGLTKIYGIPAGASRAGPSNNAWSCSAADAMIDN